MHNCALLRTASTQSTNQSDLTKPCFLFDRSPLAKFDIAPSYKQPALVRDEAFASRACMCVFVAVACVCGRQSICERKRQLEDETKLGRIRKLSQIV